MEKITTLRDETIELLRARPAHITSKKIAELLGVNRKWLNLLVSGKIDDPGVNKIQTLNSYLKSEIKKVSINV